MNKSKCFSQEISVFHRRTAPELSILVGYGALIVHYELAMPFPAKLSIVSKKHKRYETEDWMVFTPRHKPNETLLDQLVFALKYEGVNLLFFKKFFNQLSNNEVVELVLAEPQSQYCRKIWFLYEWLLDEKLSIPDLKSGNYVPLLIEKQQYALSITVNSPRHRIINNLPGTRDFCPLIHKTPKLESSKASTIELKIKNSLNEIHKDVLLRTSAFLLLQDSKASFTIEGESPKNKRTARWANAIGQAGMSELTMEELLRLQQVVIENDRFVAMGFRKAGGFVGEHDRNTGEPIPSHISARWQDVEQLINGMLDASVLLMKSEMDAVVSATAIAFGFVFIHPFEDGNGRIHRYLIHHVLAKKQFTQQGVSFPVSASILNHMEDYRKVLESYSQPLLDFIEWEETKKHNVDVLNDTIDFYRYFDATKQAEFLYDCVNDTIENIIPHEIDYLIKYDQFKHYLDNEYEMPDATVALLVNFLEQNNGKLSKRAREKEFTSLTAQEIVEIEKKYESIFMA
jgi:fido (protein-threonine AMPylation protein)